MKSPVALIAVLAFAVGASGQTQVFNQPHNGTGTILRSCWWEPDDSDYDQYIWDAFTLPASNAITEIRWRGGFDPAYMGWGGPVVGYTIEIWSSIAGGSQPDIGSVFQPNPLMHYEVSGNAGQSAAGTFGGVAMYDYHYTLPAAFQATAGTKYWVSIVAWQHGIPDWGFAAASGGNGSYFRYVRGAHQYQTAPGDAAFSLYTTGGATYTISATASPASAGTVLGAGQYPAGSSVSLTANANAGWGFSRWTENGTHVSTSSTYVFPATADRTLVANFVPAFIVTTGASPIYAGSTTGDGVFNSGTNVTVAATANPGFVFVEWSEYGATVSTSPNYTFQVGSDRPLVANFAPDSGTVVFDFDDAPIHTSLPVDLSSGPLSAHFSAPGFYGYSIQFANALGFTPSGFEGFCVYPNSVFAADLQADFSQPLTFFSIMYSPQEIGCDDSARMRATAYLNGAQVGTNTTTAPNPGTWPTGILSISVPSGFDCVVMHYDARPPTCQDYGVIFLADNCVVTMAEMPPGITQQPSPAAACPNASVWFYVGAAGSAPLSYQWRRNGMELPDGVTPQGSIISGATSDTLVIAIGANTLDAGSYDCVVNNALGFVTSESAQLSVSEPCDTNCNGTVNPFDIQQFVGLMSGTEWPCSPCAGDANGDGTVNPFDINAFLACLGA